MQLSLWVRAVTVLARTLTWNGSEALFGGAVAHVLIPCPVASVGVQRWSSVTGEDAAEFLFRKYSHLSLLFFFFDFAIKFIS